MILTLCPDCRGNDCQRYQAQRSRSGIGCSEKLDPAHPRLDGPLEPVNILRRELGRSGCSDAHGVLHKIPDDTTFDVHVITMLDGEVWYSALYSGEQSPQELIEASPVWVDGE